MRRISVTIPDKLADALERAAQLDPTKPPRSRIISEALLRYLGYLYPQLFRREDLTGPTVLTALRSARPHAPSPSLRRTRLTIGKWKRVEG